MASVKINSGIVGIGSVGLNQPGSANIITADGSIPEDSPYVDVYVLSGQSNVGRARTSEMTSLEARQYEITHPYAKIFNPYVSTTAVNTIQVGVNTMLSDADSLDEFGCEAALFKKLPPAYRYLVKYGDGNTSMQSFWSALANREGWLNLKSYVTTVVDIIKLTGKIPVMKAFIWMQGESDAGNESFANNYEWRLQGCHDDFKTFWEGILTANSWSPQTYKWVVGRVTPAGAAFEDVLRTAQANFCAVPTNNAVLIDRDSYPLRDPSHTSATGQIMFGTDIYNALI